MWTEHTIKNSKSVEGTHYKQIYELIYSEIWPNTDLTKISREIKSDWSNHCIEHINEVKKIKFDRITASMHINEIKR